MNLTEQIKMIVNNQNALNAKAYDTAWLEKGREEDFDYRMAAVQELAEFNNSFWMPWWSKENVKDLVNCRIELVDALHFLLSQAIIEDGIDGAVVLIVDAYDSMEEAQGVYTDKEVNARAKYLINRITRDSFSTTQVFRALFDLSRAIGFGIDGLIALYMGKSTLNQFRQDHGYKQKLYKKNWPSLADGGKDKEDNYYLADFVARTGAPTPEEVRNFLEREYALRFPATVGQAEQAA